MHFLVLLFPDSFNSNYIKSPKQFSLEYPMLKTLTSFVYLDYLYALSLLMLFNTSVVKSIIAVNIKIYTGNNPMLIYWAISPNNGGIKDEVR